MTAVAWREVGAVDPRKLAEARRQAHSAVQWLARVALSYVPPAEDLGHADLAWDDASSAFETQEIAPGLTVELRLPELAMQFKEHGQRVSHQIVLDDRSPAEVEAWFLVEMLHRGVDRDRLSKQLPYEVPDLLVGDAVHYHCQPHADALKELANWYANAVTLLSVLSDEVAGERLEASPVRCSPRRFDIASVIGLDDGGKTARVVRVGFSPGDAYYDEPYFYVTPSPRASPWELPDLPGPGHWHKKGFVGAVLTASRIVEGGVKPADVLTFLRDAIAACRKAV